jgi:hypothetical protein
MVIALAIWLAVSLLISISRTHEAASSHSHVLPIVGVTMREKKSGALQKLKKRLSHSFGRLCKFCSTCGMSGIC